MAIFYKITHEEANFDLIPQGADYDALMPILKKALAKNIDERYRTAYEFAVDLREWLKAHATTVSSQNVLEALVDLEAPTHPPLPMTEAPGLTHVPEGATVDLGRRGPRKGTMPPTRIGGRTVTGGAAATMRPEATRVVTAPPLPRAPVRPQPAAKPSVLPWVAMALALVAVGVAGFIAWKSLQAPATPPPTLAVATPTPPPPTTIVTPTPPPVTAAPAPTFEEAGGKAAAQVHAAQAAFKSGSYDRAVAAAQQALREDAENETAKKILAQAMVGQKAAAQVRGGEAALARGDIAAAEAGAAEALKIAPWDPGAVELSRKIDAAKLQAQRDAEARAQQQRTAQINGLISEATGAMERKQYEAAIAAYNRVLEMDPGNQAASIGKSNALTAKTVAEAAAAGPRPGGGPVRSFVAGRTEAKGSEQGGLVGFEDSAGVDVKKGTAAAELPGKLVFDAAPPSPKPGERFKVSVYLSNEGAQPIQLASMTVATVLDGRRQSGPVPLSVTTVAPGQRAPVYQTPGDQVWREGTQSWSMEIVLKTTKGETYRNTLSWK
jgi:tetratricopeptide (TPR) repeat protein